MKFLAIILALAIFAGSPASVFCEEKPASRLEQLKQNVGEYVRDISRPLEHQGELLRQSDVVQTVKEQTMESLLNISRRFSKLWRELPSEVEEAFDVAFGIPAGVVEKLYGAIQGLSSRLEPTARDIYSALDPIMASHVEPALEKVKPYADMLRARMQEAGQRQTEGLKSRLQELQTMGPEIESYLEQLREFQVALQPLADDLQDAVKQRVEGAVSVVSPYAKPVLETVREHTKDFKTWVNKPLFADGEQ